MHRSANISGTEDECSPRMGDGSCTWSGVLANRRGVRLCRTPASVVTIQRHGRRTDTRSRESSACASLWIVGTAAGDPGQAREFPIHHAETRKTAIETYGSGQVKRPGTWFARFSRRAQVRGARAPPRVTVAAAGAKLGHRPAVFSSFASETELASQRQLGGSIWERARTRWFPWSAVHPTVMCRLRTERQYGINE